MSESIGIKVEELLNLDLFQGAVILSGKAGLGNAISKINVMEVPDVIDWVKSGEFLLTTGYSIKDDLYKLNDLIPRMHEIGVAGIGIKTKRYIDKLPDSVIETAEALNFPIVEIPAEVSYGDVITCVLSEIVNKQAEILKQVDQFNGKLTEIMLHGGDLKEIAQAMISILNMPVAILEDVFKTYELSSDEAYTDALAPIVKDLIKTSSPTHQHERVEVIDMIHEQAIDRYMMPICTDERNYGYVIIWDVHKVLTDQKIYIIEAATSLIALNLIKKLSVFENENKHRIEFIESLLSDEVSYQTKAIEKASYFNFSKSSSYSVVILAMNEISVDVRLTPNNSRYLQFLNSKIVATVERLNRQHKGKIIYGNKSDRLIMLVKAVDDSKSAVISLCDELLDYFKLEHIEDKISIGVGRLYHDYRLLHKSYKEANKAILNLSMNKKVNHLLHFDDLGIYRILSHESLQNELKQFYDEMLGHIVIYDKEKDGDLIATLRAYFECGRNVKKVSEVMFTHYNTVIYRLQRIKEIANINLDDPETALNIHVALKIGEFVD